MDVIDKYIDIVYNDKQLSNDDLEDYNNYHQIIMIFLGLIKQGNYNKAEIIMPKIIIFLRKWPIKVRKYNWQDKLLLNVHLTSNSMYMNEKNLLFGPHEYAHHYILYTNIFQHNNSIEHIKEYFARHISYVTNDKILKIYMAINNTKHSDIRCADEKLTRIFYTKILNYKLPDEYIFAHIYEIQVACELNMNISRTLIYKTSLVTYTIMNDLFHKLYYFQISYHHTKIKQFIIE